jgi:hypothetical protein
VPIAPPESFTTIFEGFGGSAAHAREKAAAPALMARRPRRDRAMRLFPRILMSLLVVADYVPAAAI